MEEWKSSGELDWALASFSWFTKFREAHIQHLNWFKSKHRPVLLKMNKEGPNKKPARRFRFIAAWVTNDSFKDLLKKNWNNSLNLQLR